MNPQHDWFETEQYSGGISRIWEPRVHSFFRANLYHVAGRDADLVIDFGMGLRSLRQFLGLKDGKPVIAVATHVHVDHVGSLHEFDCRLGHSAEATAYSTMSDTSTLADFFRTQPDCVLQAPDPKWTPDRYRITPAPLSDVLDEGAQVDLGDRRFRVLHLPGHSSGSIGLLDEMNGVLFSGDAIYDGTLVDDLPGCDKGEYRKTMERLCDLDLSIAYGGHGPPMSRERMQSLAANYLERRS
jgi:glyoxylase-like metal-dependent hydrolase (beta-lactamase superfamily II)